MNHYRLFACELAEELLLEETQRGKEVPGELRHAVQVARDHAARNATDEILSSMWNTCRYVSTRTPSLDECTPDQRRSKYVAWCCAACFKLISTDAVICAAVEFCQYYASRAENEAQRAQIWRSKVGYLCCLLEIRLRDARLPMDYLGEFSETMQRLMAEALTPGAH